MATPNVTSPVFVIVGGGIAGVTCAEELSRLSPTSQIILISSSPLIKAVTNFVKISRTLESFDVGEKPTHFLTASCPNVTVHHSTVSSLDPPTHTVHWDNDHQSTHYTKLCICTGGVPNVIAADNQHVIGIRDTESVQDFQERLSSARRIMVVGNGGIATELVFEVRGCDVVWAIKDNSIGQTFFDEGAATFFLPHLSKSCDSAPEKPDKYRRPKYTLDATGSGGSKETRKVYGGALGPDWSAELSTTGSDQHKTNPRVHIEYECSVESVHSLHPPTAASASHTPKDSGTNYPVRVRLTNGREYDCDFIVSATGVTPNMAWIGEAVKNKAEVPGLAEDGGITVDSAMRSSVEGVYAAGDVCSVEWADQSSTWFPMRLWTQARQMGAYVAKCMDAHCKGETVVQDFCFELFAHVTRFFGYKVVLLGRYNAQGLGKDCELLIRCTKGVEYVKVVLQCGRMVGAILIGETDLEETFENLILNGMDLSMFGESLLDPNVDIEDYFD